jgi:hypothetical protein
MKLSKPSNKSKKQKQCPPVNICMVKQPSFSRTKKKNKKIFFKQNQIPTKRKTFRKKYNKSKLVNIIKIIFIIVLFCGLLFLLIKVVSSIREENQREYQKENVIGLDNIPVYPDSSFMFSNELNDPYVSNFLSSGNSAYKILDDKNIDDVYAFYAEELPKIGWTYIQTVPTGSEEMKNGMYWENGSKGLRIYSKYKDIWYETISIEDAQNGLKSRIEEEIARDLLLNDKDTQDLLPDFPWILEIPKDYLITYHSTDLEKYRSVEFKKLGTNTTLSLVPIGKYSGEALDVFLQQYITKQTTEGQSCVIKSTVLAPTQYSAGLRANLSCPTAIHISQVLINPNDGIVYIIDTTNDNEEFFNFVLENLKPQNTLKY